MSEIVIVLLVILIVLFYRIHMLPKRYCAPPIVIMPMGSFKDLKGKEINGTGLTPLTTPRMKPCPQLLLSEQSQEVQVLEPTKL